nr:lysoplasmalogenase family protein [Flaviflexus massiliensis]
MAILATGLGAYATVGAIIFPVSDALIALRAFADFTLPVHGFIVMLTYVLGQSLLIYAISLHGSAGQMTLPREDNGD